MDMVSARLIIDLDMKDPNMMNALKYAMFRFGIGHFSIHLILKIKKRGFTFKDSLICEMRMMSTGGPKERQLLSIDCLLSIFGIKQAL